MAGWEHTAYPNTWQSPQQLNWRLGRAAGCQENHILRRYVVDRIRANGRRFGQTVELLITTDEPHNPLLTRNLSDTRSI